MKEGTSRTHITFTAAVWLLGMIATFIAFVFLSRQTIERDEARLGKLVDQISAKLFQTVNIITYGLGGAHGVFAASKSVKYDQFKSYVYSRDLPVEFPSVWGFGFIKYVKRKDLELFLEETRADNQPDFEIRNDGQNPDLFIIKYIFPEEQNRQTIGLDISFEKNRREAALMAIDSGKPTLTRRLHLVQDQEARAGFLFLRPVFKKGMPVAAVEERRRAIEGWVYAPVTLEKIVAPLIQEFGSLVTIAVYEDSHASNESLLFGSLHGENLPTKAVHLQVGQRPWTVLIQPRARFFAEDPSRYLAYASLALGSVLSFIIAHLTSTFLRKSQRAFTKRIREGEALIRDILRSANSSIIVTDAGGIIRVFNRSASEWLGYDADEVVGKLTPEIFHDPEEVRIEAEKISRNLNRPIEVGFEVFIAESIEGLPSKKEWTYIRKDGTRLPIELSVTVMRDDRGQITGFMGIAEDITERKLREEEIREASEQLSFFKQALDQHAIVSIANVKGEITNVNDKFCEISKYSREELLGADHRIVNSGFHSKEFMRDLWRTIAAGRPWHGEVKNRAKDGSEYWVATSIVPFLNAQGKPTQYISIRTDITTQKRNELTIARRAADEELLHKIAAMTAESLTVEQASKRVLELLCVHTGWPLGHIYFVSEGKDGNTSQILIPSKIWYTVEPEKFQNIIEVTEKTTFAPGMGLPGRVLESKRTAWIEDLHKDSNFPRAKLANDIEVSSAIGIPLIIKNRVAAVLELFSSVNCAPSRELLTFLESVAYQLTRVLEKQQAETDILMINQDLARSNKELADFAYVVSHDLKAPLRGINSIATWLTDDYADKLGEDGCEQLQLMTNRIGRMSGLIEGLLQFARVGREGLGTSRVDLQSEAASLVELLAIPQEISVTIDTPLPVIYFEAVRIRQVLQNLLSNAVKYMGKPSGEIHLGCIRKPEEMQLYVRDSGIGIEEKYFGKIFQLFQTLQARDEFESTGVGLALVKKIVEGKGGRVWIESEVGVGSTFWFSLPNSLLVNPSNPAQHARDEVSASS